MRQLIFAALAGFTIIPNPVSAADYSDPTWPCIQRKVENLSLGLMWPLALPEEPVRDDALRREIDDLADTLSVRRLEIDALRGEVEDFVSRWPDQTENNLGRVFERTFETLNKRRSRVIAGIADFSLSQIALAEKIDTNRLEMDAALATSDPDFDRVDKLEEQLDWDQVIFTDRQKSITYLCETPQLIEKRLFAIARMLQEVANNQ